MQTKTEYGKQTEVLKNQSMGLWEMYKISFYLINAFMRQASAQRCKSVLLLEWWVFVQSLNALESENNTRPGRNTPKQGNLLIINWSKWTPCGQQRGHAKLNKGRKNVSSGRLHSWVRGWTFTSHTMYIYIFTIAGIAADTHACRRIPTNRTYGIVLGLERQWAKCSIDLSATGGWLVFCFFVCSLGHVPKQIAWRSPKFSERHCLSWQSHVTTKYNWFRKLIFLTFCSSANHNPAMWFPFYVSISPWTYWLLFGWPPGRRTGVGCGWSRGRVVPPASPRPLQEPGRKPWRVGRCPGTFAPVWVSWLSCCTLRSVNCILRLAETHTFSQYSTTACLCAHLFPSTRSTTPCLRSQN